MRGSAKKTPTTTKKGEGGVGGGSNSKTQSVEKTSGKKLKQARLPFKILASGTDESARDAATERQTDTRKRKLSYDNESEPTESETTENSKENVNGLATKKARSGTDDATSDATAAAEEVIVLDDSSDDAEAAAKATPATTKTKVNKQTPKTAKDKKRQSSAGTPKQSKLVDSSAGTPKQSKLVDSKSANQGEVNAKKDETPKVLKVEVDRTETTAKVQRATPKKHNTTSREDNVEDNKNATTTTQQNKRRKSIRNTTKVEATNKQTPPKEQTDSSDDIEAIAVEHNPQKRLKVANDATNEKTEGESSEEIASKSSSSEEQELNTTNNADNATNSDAGKSAVKLISRTKNVKNLTPKQQKLHDQRRKAREEKERKLQQEKEQKQREKEEREQAKKLEREQRDEQRRKEREEKEEQRRKEREEKDEQKRLEREEKERKRFAEQEAKNEEKRKKEQEKEEAEQKKKREAAAFTKFFLTKTTTNSSSNAQKIQPTDGVEATQLAFQPFQVKGDMKLAPIKRNSISSEARSELDKLFEQNNDDDELTKSQLYLCELHAGVRQAKKWTKPSTEIVEDDVMVVEDDLARVGQAIEEEVEKRRVERLRAKFLKFHENRRPPYYGTWRKKTTKVKARRPFAQDTKYLDYEVDSDLEWEEEEPGESLDGSCDEKDKESEDDDYEVDNEWFVPHGHLSDEELQNDEEFVDGNTREAQQAKLQILQQEFAQEMRKETKKIKPRLIGCIWVGVHGKQPGECPNIIWETLDKRAMLCNGPISLDEPKLEPNETESNNSPPIEKIKAIVLTAELQKELARLVHGNKHSKNFLINEFIAYLAAHVHAIKSGEALLPSKAMLREQIENFAVWKATEVADGLETTNSNGRKQKKPKKMLCWIVSDEVLARLELAMLTLENSWNYVTTPKFATTTTTNVETKTTELNNKASKETTTTTSIVKFTKVLASTSPKTTTTTTTTNVSAATQTNSKKKRVPLLMSVPRGEQIPTATKNALIKQYLKKDTTTSAKSAKSAVIEQQPPPALADVDDDIIMLD